MTEAAAPRRYGLLHASCANNYTSQLAARA